MSDEPTPKKSTRRPQPRRSALAGANPITPAPESVPGPPAPPTAITEPPAAQSEGDGQAVTHEASPETRTTKSTKASTVTKPPQGATTERLGIYLTAREFSDARGAYLADWTNGGACDTFGRWVARAITTHAARTPKQREALARPVGRAATKTGESRSWPIATEAVQAMREAIAVDQQAGRWPSDSAWCGDAITAATAAARKANGGILPEPPARLPNRLKRA